MDKFLPSNLSKENINNLPFGNIDTIITSPPYATSLANENPNRRRDYWKTSGGYQSGHGTETYGDSKDNIGNLPLGSIDIVITSPPYADAKKGVADAERMAERWDEKFREKGENWDTWGKTWKTPGRVRGLESLGSGYSESRDNIGNLPIGNVDTIITSPPYEGSFEGGSRHTGGILEREKGEAETRLKIGLGVKYSDDKNNIGNLKKETYLEAMFKVYSEMYRVLKPSGLAIIIVKPFIRNKKIVDLPYHTWLLMSKVGFKLEKLYKLRLQSQSFWRILYYKKNPNVPRIAHEYILICRKL
jgi:DNA modification methylase